MIKKIIMGIVCLIIIGAMYHYCLWLLIILIISGAVAAILIALNEHEKARVENEKKMEDERLEKIRHDAEQRMCSLFTNCLIIDTNIWMDPDLDSFFALLLSCCQKMHYCFYMYNNQFDEIINLRKNRNDRRSKLANLALKRIENFQESGALRLRNLGLTRKKDAYADTEIMHILMQVSSKNTYSTLVTNDKELRIRVRANNRIINCNIVETKGGW